MKKYLVWLLVSAIALAGLTFAQDYYGKDGKATEKITVKIPPRLVLHLQESEWVLDLSKVQPLIAAEDAPGWHEGCQLIPKSVQYKLDTYKALHDWGRAHPIPVSTYPAYIPDGNGVQYDDKLGWMKGGLVCHNVKVIQKFSNIHKGNTGWKLNVDVTGLGKVGKFYIGDYVKDEYNPYNKGVGYHAYSGNNFNAALAKGPGTTNGFLDDIIYEGFYFDGTEVAGNHAVNVMFTLTTF